MAKKEFTADSKLGFMRFFQFYSIFVIALNVMLLIFVTGSTITFSFYTVNALFGVLLHAVCFWLIANRKKHGRQIIIVLLAISSFGEVALLVSYGTGILTALLSPLAKYLFILYFATSRRAKAVLVQPFSDETLAQEAENKSRKMWDLKSLNFWLRILIYFFVFSVVGHWMEASFCMLVNAGIMPGNYTTSDAIQFRDNLNPFFIYGLAFCFCGLVLYPINQFFLKKFNGKKVPALLASFVVAMIFVAAAELILGFVANQDYSVWDYRNQPFNFMGQICLSYSLMFSVVAMVMSWFVYPLLERMFSYVNRDVFRIVFAVSLVSFFLLIAAYNIDLNTLMPGNNITIDASKAANNQPALGSN